MIISKSFDAVGSGNAISIKHGQYLDYSVSGTFDATVVLEKSTNGGLSWEPVDSYDAPESGRLQVKNANQGVAAYRFRCSEYDSGDADTALEDAYPNAISVITPAGTLGKVGATSGWVVSAGDDLSLATCPESQSDSTLVVPIIGLRKGDVIRGFHLIGQIESASGSVTLDCDLRMQTAAAADVSDAALASMTQIAVIADTAIDESNSQTSLAIDHVVGANETFYALITASTDASTDIAIQGVSVQIEESR